MGEAGLPADMEDTPLRCYGCLFFELWNFPFASAVNNLGGKSRGTFCEERFQKLGHLIRVLKDEQEFTAVVGAEAESITGMMMQVSGVEERQVSGVVGDH